MFLNIIFKCVCTICCHKSIQGHTLFCFSTNWKDADEILGILTSHFQLVHRLVSYVNFRVFPHTDQLPWNRLQNIPSQFVSAHHVSIKKYMISVFLFVFGSTAPRRPGPPHSRGFKITQRRITFGRTPLDEWSARRRDLYLTTHNTHNWQTSMPPVGFEPTIAVGERPQT